MAELKLADDGFLSLSIGEKTNQIDLWEFYNRLLEARQEVTEAELPVREFHARVVKILDELGFPGISHKIANTVATEVQSLVDAEAKKNKTSTRPSAAESSEPSSSDSKAA
jgi:hypothetical protein